MGRVTSDDFGDRLLAALDEAVEIEEGRREPARVVRHKLTTRVAEVVPPRSYKGPAIARIRKRMGLSQPVFARVLNASPATVKAWERGEREPDGISLRLLEVADKHPEVLEDVVRTRGAKAHG